MARQPRIQVPGAVYYCSARGLNGQPIVLEDAGRNACEILVEQVVSKTGWILFSWALMNDEYHLVFRAPEANLIEGMRWLQNSWVKQFNTRHRRSGSLFASRYRNVMIDEDRFLPGIIDYVHLTPFRGGLTNIEEGLARHQWCSLRDYLLPADRRRPWVSASGGLAAMGYDPDVDEDRLAYLKHLERIVEEEKAPSASSASLSIMLRRGWRTGADDSASRLPSPDSSPAAVSQHHGPAVALHLLKAGLAMEGLTYESLSGLKKSDWRKRAIGRAIRRTTTVPVEWIASNLNMGTSSRASRLVRDDPGPAWGHGWPRALALMTALESLGGRDDSASRTV